MENSYRPKIEFYKQRRFGEKINATFEFIRENWRNLFKIIFIIDGPLVAVCGISYGFYMNSIFQMSGGQAPDLLFSDSSFWLSIIVMFISGWLLTFTFFAIVYRYMKLYMEMPPQEITLKIILKTIMPDAGILFVLSILYAIIMAVGFVVFIIPGVFFSVTFCLAFTIVIFEDYNVIRALKRSFLLIRDNWWSTVGLMFVITLLQSSIGALFAIPMYGYMIFQVFESVDTGQAPFADSTTTESMIMMACTTFLYLGSLFTYVLSAISLTFQYFNLREKHEAVGLLSKIERMETVG